MKHFFLTLNTIIIYFFISSFHVHAEESLYTSLNITYAYDNNGKSQVTQDITLTNKYSASFASSFQLKLFGETPSDISVTTNNEPLPFTTQQINDQGLIINISFKQPVVGKGQDQSFRLKYTGTPAKKNGQIWEINIPKLQKSELVDNFQLQLLVPTEFGKPAYISPSPDTSDSLQHKYTFSKNQLLNSGLIAAFGNLQTYDYQLTYYLENSTSKTTSQTISIPPDTEYQRVNLLSIQPRPLNIVADRDGNWLANYSLPARTNLQIQVTGQIHSSAQPLNTHPLTDAIQKEYLQPTHYWNSDSPQIQKIAADLHTPRQIYDYVVNTLSYNSQRVGDSGLRQGGLKALQNPSNSLCTDFTDLFISLSRAAGIPAREIQGLAYSANPQLQPVDLNSDILHSWPQYYDTLKHTWISVDPNWGKTSNGYDYFNQLDLSHLAFVVHGLSDSLPKSPGLYKKLGQTKNIEVSLGEYKDTQNKPPLFDWQQSMFYWPFIQSSTHLKVTNPNSIALYSIPINFSTNPTAQNKPFDYQIDVIPPYSFTQINLPLTFPLFPLSGSKTATITTLDNVLTYNIPDNKFVLFYVLIIITTALTIFTMAYFAHFAWNIYLQKRSTGHHIRR